MKPDSTAAPRYRDGIAQNPFPATAVARLTRPEDEFWSIETDALKQARGFLRDYLHSRKQRDRSGKDGKKGLVIAIVGDYGTGKTHIAQDMLREIDAQHDPSLHPMYLDAPSDTFLALYRERFMAKVSRAEVLQRVEDLYSDVVANELERSDVTAPAAKLLKSREANPDEVVNSLGLMESALLRELGVRLRRVTERQDFGTALLLLRRPEFEAAVWEWLSGSPPDPILQERGIERQINDDVAALEAIGVLAFLFGRQGHRFILFIDELEKVFSQNGRHRPDEAAVLAFKKLFEVIGETQSLLVLIGLPECLEVLPDDARQRISGIIHPSAITAGEIENYIREAQRRGLAKEVLEPFTKDTVEYLAEIAGGNTRRVLRLCYHAFLGATEAGTNVTRAALRQIAREQFEVIPTDDVVAEITRSLEARGWLFERDKVIRGKSKLQIDFWLPVGSDDSGIAIFLTNSVLQENDSKDLVSAAVKVKGASPLVEAVLVVNGYLADNMRAIVDQAFAKVVPYKLRDFREDLDAVLAGVRVRLEEGHRQDVLQLIRQKVDEIARQNSGVDSRLSELMQIAVTRTEIHHAVSAGVRGVFGQLATGAVASDARFSMVAAVFDRTVEMLQELLQLDLLFDEVFGVPTSTLNAESRKSSSRRTRAAEMLLKRLSGLEGLGTGQSLLQACFAFRRGTMVVLSHLGDRAIIDERSSVSYRELVGDLCQTFDVFTREIDLRRVVTDLQSARGRLQLDPERQLLTESEEERVGELEKKLRDLGKNVYYAVRDELERGLRTR
jgi:Cdc6-like AAA superfamily ATPase